MMLQTGVDAAVSKTQQRIGATGPREGGDDEQYLSVEKLRKQYLDYLHVKQPEIIEQRTSRHYYHSDQWTAKEIKELKKRNQPVTTDNRIARKIDAVVGVLERLRQDPKAYPRTPQHDQGSEVATAALRYVLDTNDWRTISPEAGRDGAIEGIGGCEVNLIQGDQGDPDVSLSIVDGDTFFYDPRSFREDFSDARYMGVAKWVDVEAAKELIPGKEDLLDGLMGDAGGELGADTDREKKWVDSENKRIRLIDHWYIKGGEWHWCIYSFNVKLMEGKSPYVDEKNKTFCRYIMYSAVVDHDGDRYGFVRNLKSHQDEINHRRSKGLHALNSRRLLAEDGALEDVEKTRKEMVRNDSVVIYRPNTKVEFEDAKSRLDLEGQLKFLEQSIASIENFGPNQALVGQGGVENSSGRAIALLQQAGIAELGPYMIGYRGWKIRVYRAVWNTLQRHWKSERWIRVTDDEGVAQFIQINGVGLDPQTGRPATINALGALDVDIILDEGPDTLTMQADSYEGLQALGPTFAQTFPDIAIKLLPGIQASVRKEILDRLKQKAQEPPPEVAAQQQKLQMEGQSQQQQIQLKQQESAADLQLRREEAAANLELERQKIAGQIELEREKAQAKLDADMALKQQQIEFDFQIEQKKAEQQTQLMKDKHAADMAMSREKAQAETELNGYRIREEGNARVDSVKAMRDVMKEINRPKQAVKMGDGKWRVEPVGAAT